MINNRESLVELLQQLELTLEVIESCLHYNKTNKTLKDIKHNIKNRIGELRFHLATNN